MLVNTKLYFTELLLWNEYKLVVNSTASEILHAHRIGKRYKVGVSRSNTVVRFLTRSYFGVSNTLLRAALMACTGTNKLNTTVVPHNEGTVLVEELPLKGLGKVIRMHFRRRTIHYAEVSLIDLVMDEKETDVQSAGALA